MNQSQWSITVKTNRTGSLFAILLIWLFLAIFTAVIVFATGEPPYYMLAGIPFALIITYYGLKSAFAGSGTLTIDSEGFTVQRGMRARSRFVWSDVEKFEVGSLGRSPVYEGHPVPHFILRDGQREGLPGNIGFQAQELVAAMERMRKLALHGWTRKPHSLRDMLSSDYDFL